MSVETTVTPAGDAVAWYRLPPEEALARLDVNAAAGLDPATAQQRLAQYGRNELAAKSKEPFWRRFLRQYQDYMQLLLLGAAVLSIVIGDFSTARLLIILTLVNAVMSLNQEGKAEQSVAALKEMLHIQARVRRGGQVAIVPAEELVPGDIVLFEAGDLVPADGRLLRAATLEIEESALTGESQPVAKQLALIDGAEVPLGDRKNLAFMNSLVTRGTGEMVVTGTGMNTEIGRIARLLDTVADDKSPLQKQIDQLSRSLGYLAIGTVLVVILFGLRNGLSGDEVFFLAISMAVAAVPTGMPTVLTSLLSLGTQQLAEAHAIVKRLASVETLGSTSAICSDKTGTLTLNKMTATVLGFAGNRYDISGVGYSEIGQIKHTGGQSAQPLERVLLPMALCNDAVVENEELVGDPTEGALVVLAQKGGLSVRGTREQYPRLAEVPFDSAYKYMATFHHMEGEDGRPLVRCYVKGAPDVLFALSSHALWQDGKPLEMRGHEAQAGSVNERMAAEGLRVLALAERDLDPADFDPEADLQVHVRDLLLLGLVGIVDPPRPEAKQAIAEARQAGVTVRMITGDHVVTAGAIGRQLGLSGEAISGAELNELNDEELAERIEAIGVVGRVAPEHKVRIVQALQSRGRITAMTGDGVNDAPALKTADIGIAMGITGTEVSKQAAVMILTDDNFATIVHAVKLGRAIYDNLMKYLRFQLITLMGYLVLFVGASILNLAGGAVLTPVQILWINFLIDVPLALALGMDKPAGDLMQRSPRRSDEQIMDRGRTIEYLFLGLFLAIAPLLAAGYVMNQSSVPFIGRTMVLTTLSLVHIAVAFSSRSETESVFSREMLSGRRFLAYTGLSALFTLLATELGFLQRYLETTALDGGQWLLAIGLAFGVLLLMEIVKFFKRRRTAIAPA